MYQICGAVLIAWVMPVMPVVHAVDNTLLRDIERYQQREQQQNLRAGLDPRPLREEVTAPACCSSTTMPFACNGW
jgi:hypothetical protein